MWKWTDENNVRVIILDYDSLDEEYLTYRYEQILNDVKVYKVSKFSSKLDVKKYIDILSLLSLIIKESSYPSSSIIAVSNDSKFLKEMIQNHIGTISIGKEDDLGCLADFRASSLKRLKEILLNRVECFSAEYYSVGSPSDKKKNFSVCSTTQVLDEDGHQCLLIIGGRYYPRSRKFLKDDALSTVVRNFKNKYEKAVDDYFDSILFWLHRHRKIDILTYVPLKPFEVDEGKFDRFTSLNFPNLKKNGIQLEKILECKKDYVQKENDYHQRFQNVSEAYIVKEDIDIRHKHIVLIDDIRTTGATTGEIAKTLYRNGAERVTVVLFAVNQTIISTNRYVSLKCPSCSSDMILRFRQADSTLFFGCTNYPDCHQALDYERGAEQLRKINQLNVEDISDMDDTY